MRTKVTSASIPLACARVLLLRRPVRVQQSNTRPPMTPRDAQTRLGQMRVQVGHREGAQSGDKVERSTLPCHRQDFISKIYLGPTRQRADKPRSRTRTGTSIAALAEYIEQFYSRLAAASGLADSKQPVASTSTSPAPDLAARTQKVDDAFVSFVWNALVDQPDVRVGVLSKIGTAGQDAPADGSGQTGADAEMVDADDAEESAKKKGKKKKIERKPEGPTHEMRILDNDERDLGRNSLVDKYGAQLRVLTGEETAWVAITGSHARVSSRLRC